MLKYFILSFIYCGLLSCTPKLATVTVPSPPDSEVLIQQDTTLNTQKPIFSIPIKAKTITIDKLNQLYLVTDKNEVIKYDSKGKEVFRYNNNFLDNLELIDATDPFNVLLYYPDYLSVITLDRTMNKAGEFDLSNLNLIQVKAVGASNDNNIWIYDEVSFKLKKVSRNGAILRQSADINLQINHNPKPIYLVERENSVYLNDPGFGILIFNIFGEYDSILELKGIEKFQIINDRLVYKKGNQLFSYHLKSFSQKEFLLPVNLKPSDEILLGKNRLFIKRDNQIEVFEVGKE